MRISKDDIVKREALVLEVFQKTVAAGDVPTVQQAQDALKALDGRAMRPGRIVELLQTVVPTVETVNA